MYSKHQPSQPDIRLAAVLCSRMCVSAERGTIAVNLSEQRRLEDRETDE
jgi:hypothetical protein